MIGCSIYGVVVIDGSLYSRFYGILIFVCIILTHRLTIPQMYTYISFTLVKNDGCL